MLDEIREMVFGNTTLIVSFIMLVFVTSWLVTRYVLKTIKNNNNLKVLRVCDVDGVYNLEFDSHLSQEDALEYIKNNYGEKALDNVEHLVIKAKDFETRLIETLYTVRRILHMVELDFIEANQIKENINAAGKLMIHVSNELRVFKNLFRLLAEKDETYKDELGEILEISQRCDNLEKRINNICLTLLTEVN